MWYVHDQPQSITQTTNSIGITIMNSKVNKKKCKCQPNRDSIQMWYVHDQPYSLIQTRNSIGLTVMN